MIFLHVITGQFAESSLELDIGKAYTISNDYDNADIYLESNQDFVLQLFVNSNSIEVLSYQGEIAIQNVPLEVGLNYDLPLIIKCSETFIILNNQDSINHNDLANKIAQDFMPKDSFESSSLSIADEITNPTEVATSASMDKWWETMLKKARFYSLELKAKSIVLWKKFRQKFGLYSYVIIAGVVVFLVIIGSGIYSIHKGQMSDNQVYVSTMTEQEILNQIASLPSKYSGLKCTRVSDRFLVSGVIKSQADISGLKKYFNQWQSQIDYQVIGFDTIKDKVIQILLANGVRRANAIFDAGSSTVNIFGISSNYKSLDDVAISVTNSFPMLGDIDDSNVYLSSDLDKYMDKLVANVVGQVTVSKDYPNGVITVSGYVTDSDKIKLESAIKDFNTLHSPIIKITSRLQNIMQLIPFGVMGVYSGSPAWIETNTGVKIYQGGSYMGVTLQSVTNTSVILKVKGNTLTIRLDSLISGVSSGNTQEVSLGCCDRKSILASEKNRLVQIISKEEKQISDLQTILKTAKNLELKTSLLETIKNLSDDLVFRKKELADY